MCCTSLSDFLHLWMCDWAWRRPADHARSGFGEGGDAIVQDQDENGRTRSLRGSLGQQGQGKRDVFPFEPETPLGRTDRSDFDDRHFIATSTCAACHLICHLILCVSYLCWSLLRPFLLHIQDGLYRSRLY